MKKFWLNLFIVSCLILSPYAFADQLVTKLSTKNIAEGQPFRLIIYYRGTQSNLNDPDTDPLKRNFSVLEVGRSQSLTIINNKVTREDEWRISLIPKKSGILKIPSLKVGNDKTRALSINVKNSLSPKGLPKDTFFIKTSITPKEPFVNSELLYQVKIFYRVNFAKALITPPKANNAIIRQLGQDKSYEAHIKNHTYQVFERRFAIFPQKPGILTISPVIFRGLIIPPAHNNSFAAYYGLNAKPVQMIAPEKQVTIKPIPKIALGHLWLPTNKFSITQDFNEDLNKLTVGTPLTRIITLKAQGLLAEQLPDIHINNSKYYNVYPAQPKLENRYFNGHLEGKKIFKVVYLPTNPGEVSLPAIDIKWWDINTNTLTNSVLPSTKLTFINSQAPLLVTQTKPVDKTFVSAKKNLSSKLEHNTSKNFLDNTYLILLIVLLACLVLLYSFRAKFKRQISSENTITLSMLRKNLIKACKQKNGKHIESALIGYVKKLFDSNAVNSLGDVCKVLPKSSLTEEIKTEIKNLQKSLYKTQENYFDGHKLMILLRQLKIISVKPKTKKTKKTKQLAGLNPE